MQGNSVTVSLPTTTQIIHKWAQMATNGEVVRRVCRGVWGMGNCLPLLIAFRCRSVGETPRLQDAKTPGCFDRSAGTIAISVLLGDLATWRLGDLAFTHMGGHRITMRCSGEGWCEGGGHRDCNPWAWAGEGGRGGLVWGRGLFFLRACRERFLTGAVPGVGCWRESVGDKGLGRRYLGLRFRECVEGWRSLWRRGL